MSYAQYLLNELQNQVLNNTASLEGLKQHGHTRFNDKELSFLELHIVRLAILIALTFCKDSGNPLPDRIDKHSLLMFFRSFEQLRDVASYFERVVAYIDFDIKIPDEWENTFSTDSLVREKVFTENSSYHAFGWDVPRLVHSNYQLQIIESWIENSTSLGLFGPECYPLALAKYDYSGEKQKVYMPFKNHSYWHLLIYRLTEILLNGRVQADIFSDETNIPVFENSVNFSLSTTRIPNDSKASPFVYQGDAYLDLQLKKTARRAVVMVGQEFLFSTKGASLSLKKKIIEEGSLVAVIEKDFYPGLTRPHVILLIDQSAPRRHKPVLFVKSPVMADELISAIKTGNIADSDRMNWIHREDLAYNQYNLDIKRYLLGNNETKLIDLLQAQGKDYAYLGDLFQVSRAQAAPKAAEDEDSFLIKEVNISDIDSYGRLNSPAKILKVPTKWKSSGQFGLQYLSGSDDYLFAIKGKVGTIAQVPNYDPDGNMEVWTAGQSFVRLSSTFNDHQAAMFLEYMMSEPVQREIRRLASGTKTLSLKVEDLKSLPVRIFSAKEAEKAKKIKETRETLLKQIKDCEALVKRSFDLDLLDDDDKMIAFQSDLKKLINNFY